MSEIDKLFETCRALLRAGPRRVALLVPLSLSYALVKAEPVPAPDGGAAISVTISDGGVVNAGGVLTGVVTAEQRIGVINSTNISGFQDTVTLHSAVNAAAGIAGRAV